jgi:hypothetical protein
MPAHASLESLLRTRGGDADPFPGESAPPEALSHVFFTSGSTALSTMPPTFSK